MTRVPVKVLIDASHLGAQAAVRDAVRAAGLAVERCVPEIGVIFGSADEADLSRLAAVAGVLQARREAIHGVAPCDPDAPC